jgi:hypothetical protein
MLALAGTVNHEFWANSFFQLPGIPAGITEGDDNFRGQPGATDRSQHVTRAGQANFAIHCQCRLPEANRPMQHKTTIQLHRATKIDRQAGEAFGIELDINFVEQARQIHVDRTIDDNAQRAVLVVLANIDESVGKIRVFKRRHGDEEVIGQIDVVHDWNFNRQRGTNQP